ncbi:MAG: hypothetical protein KGJ88_03775 [Verrucomicrobiota bacterium]|nr:hypothetical protein [Verrucomicrobiota bacterium]
MNKIPKEKLNHLILVGVGTALALAAVWFLVIGPQRAAVAASRIKMAGAQKQYQDVLDSITRSNSSTNALEKADARLVRAESDMASNDPNVWIYDFVRRLNNDKRYKVTISVQGETSVEPVNILPKFPYKQLKVLVGGTAYYHDLGRFIADLENNHPYIRLVDLTIEPQANGEKLSFTMQMITLIKPTA